MPELIILVFPVVVGLFGLIFVLTGLGKILVGLQAWRDELDTVADAVDGARVSLKGTVKPHEKTLTASVLDRECIGYKSSTNTGNRSGSVDTAVVPFLLECDDGTVLVDVDDDAVDILDDHGRASKTNQWALLPDETAYVSGVARFPDSVDIEVPPEADAVVGRPAPASGAIDRLRLSLRPLSFYVSDAPRSQTLSRKAKRGAGLIVLGVALPGVVLGLGWLFV